MDSVSDKFDLHATLVAIGQAIGAVLGHMVFEFALHGLFMAILLGFIGAVFLQKRHRFAAPLLRVARRVAIVCLVLMLPGGFSLLVYGALPSAGVFNVNSIGFFCAWSLICLHLSAEEINHSQTTT
jgi:predicted branched-subunit amino acid permease